MNLTREQAIAEHRKMWNWIADAIEQCEAVISIPIYKKNYCISHGYKGGMECDCFLCEYASENNISCEDCILVWGNHKEDACCQTFGCFPGLYSKVTGAKTWKEQSDIARQIANLPEREDV